MAAPAYYMAGSRTLNAAGDEMTDEPKTQVPARRFQRRCTRSSSVMGRPRSLDRTRYTELAKYR